MLHTTPKQLPLIWEYGPLIFPTNSTSLLNWEQCYNCSTKENWFFQCRELPIIVALFLKLWYVIIATVPAKPLNRQWLMPKLRTERKGGRKIRCVGFTYNKKEAKFLKCGSVSGGIFIKLIDQSKIISQKTFTTNVPWVRSVSCKDFWMGSFLDMIWIWTRWMWFWISSTSAWLRFKVFSDFQ